MPKPLIQKQLIQKHFMPKHRRAVLRATALAALMVAAGALAPVVTPTHSAQAAHASSLSQGDCEAGELCLWPKKGFSGERRTHELLHTSIDQCTPLAEGEKAAAFANLSGRPVTVYQSDTCDTTGDFRTYPSGAWVPEAPYAVRAFTMWER